MKVLFENVGPHYSAFFYVFMSPYFLIHLFCIIKKYKFITVNIYFIGSITNFNQHASMNRSMIKKHLTS